MIGNYFARLTGSKRNLLALMASSVVFSAGCANMTSTAPSANPFSTPATLSGNVHGGNQPVTSATVTLWFAGQNGFSGGAIKAATTTTDTLGNFSFVKDTAGGHDGTTDNYSCPTTGGSPLVYVTSIGGNTQNNGATQNNSAAAFMALYGDCSTLSASNFVYMSEVTTVATMAAVSQFFNPATDNLAADGTGQQRLIILNLPNTVALMANAATGLAVASQNIPAAAGNIAPSTTLTATPETAKINLMANIISACINAATSADPKCTALFTSAVPPAPNVTNLNPPSFAQATDTLQALYYMFVNPTSTKSGTSNISSLFALSPATGAPYAPSLATPPTDWTIGISYASTSTCGTPTGGTGSFISSPTDINVDALDNVWFSNAQTGGNLSSISAAGAPFACINFDPGTSHTGGTFDSNGAATNTPTPNVWTAGGTTLYRYSPNSGATLAFPVGVTPLAMTADGVGNVYFTATSGTTGSLYVLPLAATAVTAVAPLQISNTVGAAPSRLMPNYKGNATLGDIWVSSGSTFISQVTPQLGGMNGFVTNQFTTTGSSYGLSIGRGGIFTAANDTGVLTEFVPNGATFSVASGYPIPAASVTAAGINKPTGIAIDGRSNTWLPNNGNGTGTGSISEINVFGTPITPSTGFQKSSSFLNSSHAVVVDQAGNVWVAGDGNNFVTEIVGAGIPIYAPYAVGLANGRFQTIP